MSNSQSFYSEEEAQKILSIASRNQISNGMSRDELIRSAAELGISAESIEQAEAEIRRQQDAERHEREEREMRARYRRQLRNKIFGSFTGYLGFSAMFVAFWLLSGGGYFWPVWVIIWPLFGGLHEIGELLSPDRAYEKWRAKQQTPSPVDVNEETESYPRGMRFTMGYRSCARERKRERRY